MVTRLHRAGWVKTPERGVALVITLIMLSVITFMAVTFLVVSRVQRGAVETDSDQLAAKLAAEQAVEVALAELVTPIIANSNVASYNMRVSTNYITRGFIPGNTWPTNVAYSYQNGLPLNNLNDLYQNLGNLLYDPRPPVFIVTNQNTGQQEFRYY